MLDGTLLFYFSMGRWAEGGARLESKPVDERSK